MVNTEISYVILIILTTILMIYFIRISINIKNIYRIWDSHKQFAKMGGKNGIPRQADTNH